jgi:hypothetical protein
MLIPFVGFVLGLVAFTILGLIVLGVVPSLRLTAINLLLFVIGAFPGTLVLGNLYGRLFADSTNYLNSRAAILGLFSVMLLGAIAGGSALVWLKMRFVKSSNRDPSL